MAIVFFSFQRVSHLEAVPSIVVYDYLLSACYFSTSYVSYNLVHWGHGMVCGLFLVGEAGGFSKVNKFASVLFFMLILYSRVCAHIHLSTYF